jgi:HME family heavy-metal exporter
MPTLLNAIIRISLSNRLLIAALAMFVIGAGGWSAQQLSIDVFPDLNRPRVVVVTEAHGLAPEEVETLVTIPLENALNGASGVQAVRTSSAAGVSIVNVEFDWDTDIFTARQVVTERLSVLSEHLPVGVSPQLAPISSILGQIAIAGMFSQPNEESQIFVSTLPLAAELNDQRISSALERELGTHGVSTTPETVVGVERFGRQWNISDPTTGLFLAVVRSGDRFAVHRATSPMEMRTLADWIVRQQLLTIPGVSQVFVMGGERKQFQVLVRPELLRKNGVTVKQVKEAVTNSNQNATGGYLDEQGPNEILVRAVGRIQTVKDLADVVVVRRGRQSLTLGQVARIIEGPTPKRGDSAAYVRADDGEWVGGPAVVLTINKQPGGDTRHVTENIHRKLERLDETLPPDVSIAKDLYEQRTFIDLAITNVLHALRDGGVLIVITLFLFLLNIRTTIITLTAIPLSLAITAIVFTAFEISINTMTLGGLAVAIGELVDDAIVDVENIFRRLRQNREAGEPKSPLLVVFQASVEIRNSIVFGTMIVVVVFLPLFALGGMEGRLFTPLGISYVVAILCSLLVSLTVTPVLSYWMLRRAGVFESSRGSLLLVGLQWLAATSIRTSLRAPSPILLLAALAVIIAGGGLIALERDFLPPFNEGAVQINVLLPPGVSLAESNRIADSVDRRLQEIPEISAVVRKTGRAETDEHAVGVNVSEIICSLESGGRSRGDVIKNIRAELGDIPGIVTGVEQPISHLISHMLSGVKAQIAVKVYGENLGVLRQKAESVRDAIAGIPGVKDLQVEPQVTIRQLKIEIDGHRLKQFGLTRGDVTSFVQTAMNGEVVSSVLQGQRTFDLVVRLDEPYREDVGALNRLPIQLADGGVTQLSSVARIYRDRGPNTINREQVRRRIVVQCNVADRGLVDVYNDIRRATQSIEESLETGYSMEFGGQFESQQSASRMIGLLFVISLVGMFLILFSMFRSVNLSLQVMMALPMAFIGSVTALYVTQQTLTIAAMVGFVSLCGIASRNGILLVNHYLHLVRFEGETWSAEMIVRAGRERVAPVLMTALTSGIGLAPLAMAAGESGKEILYPVATVIIGGLISSTLLEFLVRPAMFWMFGIDAARQVVESQGEEKLVEESCEGPDE